MIKLVSVPELCLVLKETIKQKDEQTLLLYIYYLKNNVKMNFYVQKIQRFQLSEEMHIIFKEELRHAVLNS